MSANEENVNTSNSQNSPLSTNSFFLSILPPRTFEQNIWTYRWDTLHDARDLDFAKQLLLNKICLDRNISFDLQLCIKDYIRDYNWYELYNRHFNAWCIWLYSTLSKIEYRDYSGYICLAPFGYYYDDNGILLIFYWLRLMNRGSYVCII